VNGKYAGVMAQNYRAMSLEAGSRGPCSDRRSCGALSDEWIPARPERYVLSVVCACEEKFERCGRRRLPDSGKGWRSAGDSKKEEERDGGSPAFEIALLNEIHGSEARPARSLVRFRVA